MTSPLSSIQSVLGSSDLLTATLQNIDDPKALHKVRLVSKAFNEVARRMLYRCLKIDLSTDEILNNVKLINLLKRSMPYLGFVIELSVTSGPLFCHEDGFQFKHSLYCQSIVTNLIQRLPNLRNFRYPTAAQLSSCQIITADARQMDVFRCCTIEGPELTEV